MLPAEIVQAEAGVRDAREFLARDAKDGARLGAAA